MKARIDYTIGRAIMYYKSTAFWFKIGKFGDKWIH